MSEQWVTDEIRKIIATSSNQQNHILATLCNESPEQPKALLHAVEMKVSQMLSILERQLKLKVQGLPEKFPQNVFSECVLHYQFHQMFDQASFKCELKATYCYPIQNLSVEITILFLLDHVTSYKICAHLLVPWGLTHEHQNISVVTMDHHAKTSTYF